MSERGFNGNGSHHQFFEQSFSEISSIELVTEFIKIELQELPLDSMVHVREYGFRIGYGRVHPRKHLVPFLGLDDTGFRLVHGLAYFHMRRGSIHDDFGGILFTKVIHGLFYGVCPKVFYDDHAQMAGLADFLPLLWSLNRPALHHYKDFGLALAAVAPFKRFIPFPLVLRGEMSLVQLCHAAELVTGIPLPHDAADFVHHFPNGLVAFVAKLALYLKDGKSLFRTGQQMDGCEPIRQRQLAALEQCTGTQGDDMLAGSTLPTLVIFIPMVANPTAMRAYQPFPLTQCAVSYAIYLITKIMKT